MARVRDLQEVREARGLQTARVRDLQGVREVRGLQTARVRGLQGLREARDPPMAKVRDLQTHRGKDLPVHRNRGQRGLRVRLLWRTAERARIS